MDKRKTMAVIGIIIMVMVVALLIEGRARFPFVNRVIMAVVSPVNSVMLGISDRVSNTTGYFTSLNELKDENAQLQKEVDSLRQDNVDYTTMKAENERLKQLLNYKTSNPSLQFLPARVIGRDLSDLKDTVIINKGSNDGLKLDMSVVTGTGLVGVVDAVYPSAARILLINSPHSRIGGMDLRGDSRIAGIVSGLAGQDAGLAMRNMARDADLLPGDTIVTSGYSGYHPPGLIIGNIQEITMDGGGLTKVATITPSVDFSRLEEVMVITNYDNFANLVKGDKAAKAKKDAEENKNKQDGTASDKKDPGVEQNKQKEGAAQ